jgi:RNA polymerase sigma factor (sigma-70 family)
MNNGLPTDGDLILRSREHDEEAFQFLMERYRSTIFGTAYLIVENHELAEEVMQEAMLKVWRHIGSLQHQERFKIWLLRIVSNEARNQFKKKRVPVISLDEVPEQVVECNLDERIIQREDHEVLKQLLSKLTPNQKEVITLRYFAELTIPQIALTTSTREGTVKSRLSRALERMNTYVQKTGKEEVNPDG